METDKRPKPRWRKKERTMARILKETGKIVQQHGVEGISVRKIARASGVTAGVVHSYFGPVDNLRKEYLESIGSHAGSWGSLIEKTRGGENIDAADLKEMRPRNRQMTMARILNETGKIVQKHGVEGINVRKVARASGVTAALVYGYFGPVDNLRKEYLKSIGYHPGSVGNLIEKTKGIENIDTADLKETRPRNRQVTMARILEETGKIIQQHGIQGGNARKIAKASGVHAILIYRYFGTMDNLRYQYMKSIERPADIGDGFTEKIGSGIDTATDLKKLMLSLWDEFRQDKTKQKILRWEIGTGELILPDPYEDTILRMLETSGKIPDTQDINALVAFISAAIYFISASADFQEKMVDIDLRSDEGMGRIENVIRRIIDGIRQ